MNSLYSRRRQSHTGIVFLAFLFALAFASTVASAQGTISATYCISGTSNGSSWEFAWEYDDGATTTTATNYGMQPVGAPCSSFAQAMADSMNYWAAYTPPVEYVVSVSGCCLVVTMNTGWNWGGLWVGNTTPNCLVTTAGCTFNPTIVLVEETVANDGMSWGALKSRYRAPDNH